MFSSVYYYLIFNGQMESLIKNNHCGLYPPEHFSRAGKINHDYFLCRFHEYKFRKTPSADGVPMMIGIRFLRVWSLRLNSAFTLFFNWFPKY